MIKKGDEHMTQTKDNIQRVAEFNALFMNLNERGQEAALTVLQALGFSLSVMFSQDAEKQRNPTKQLV